MSEVPIKRVAPGTTGDGASRGARYAYYFEAVEKYLGLVREYDSVGYLSAELIKHRKAAETDGLVVQEMQKFEATLRRCLPGMRIDVVPPSAKKENDEELGRHRWTTSRPTQGNAARGEDGELEHDDTPEVPNPLGDSGHGWTERDGDLLETAKLEAEAERQETISRIISSPETTRVADLLLRLVRNRDFILTETAGIYLKAILDLNREHIGMIGALIIYDRERTRDGRVMWEETWLGKQQMAVGRCAAELARARGWDEPKARELARRGRYHQGLFGKRDKSGRHSPGLVQILRSLHSWPEASVVDDLQHLLGANNEHHKRRVFTFNDKLWSKLGFARALDLMEHIRFAGGFDSVEIRLPGRITRTVRLGSDGGRRDGAGVIAVFLGKQSSDYQRTPWKISTKEEALHFPRDLDWVTEVVRLRTFPWCPSISNGRGDFLIGRAKPISEVSNATKWYRDGYKPGFDPWDNF